MDMHEQIKQRADYTLADIDARYLKTAYQLWGEQGLRRALEEMGPDRAAKARVILDL